MRHEEVGRSSGTGAVFRDINVRGTGVAIVVWLLVGQT